MQTEATEAAIHGQQLRGQELRVCFLILAIMMIAKILIGEVKGKFPWMILIKHRTRQ